MVPVFPVDRLVRVVPGFRVAPVAPEVPVRRALPVPDPAALRAAAEAAGSVVGVASAAVVVWVAEAVLEVVEGGADRADLAGSVIADAARM